jgi:hypothetical protein
MRLLSLALISIVLIAADRGIGTWEFVPEKSRYESGPAPRKSVREWIARGERVEFRHQGVSADGKAFATSFTAGYDGQPATVSGSGRYDKVRLRLLDDSTVEQIFTLRGEVTVETIRRISADGQEMVIEAKGSNPNGERFFNRLVYRRIQGKN